jgi:hypothetical protein
MKTIKLRGRTYKLFSETVDVFKLNYYTKNPRIHDLVIENNAKTNKDIDKIMWTASEQKNVTRRLRDEIIEDGKVNEPLIVDKNNNVLEGNTRLACLRDLISKKMAGSWKKVDIHRIKTKLSERDILEIMGSVHLKGKKTDWKPFQLASHLNSLKNSGLDDKEINEITGISIISVNQNIKAYKLAKEDKARDTDFTFYKDNIVKNQALLNKVSKNMKVPLKAIRKTILDKYRKSGDVNSQFSRKLKTVATNQSNLNELFTNKNVSMNYLHKRAIQKDVTLSDTMIKNISELTNELKSSLTVEQRERWKQIKYLKIIDNHVKTLRSLYFDLGINKKWPK